MGPTPTPPSSLARLLGIFASGTRAERVSISRVEKETREFFSDHVEQAGRMLNAGSEAYRAHSAINLLLRVTWSLVPARLLSGAAPDFHYLAREALVNRFGPFSGIDDVANSLTVIFKRIRNYARSGRQATSLDLGRAEHVALLADQHGRCNLCKYEFRSVDFVRMLEDDEFLQVHEPACPEEVRPSKIYRQPELDHIVPIILGGDSENNWQILCRSCNLGKSDYLTHLNSVMGPSLSRFGGIEDLSQGKRYATIANASADFSPTMIPSDGGYFRVFKINSDRLCTPENLVAKYCKYSGATISSQIRSIQ